MNPQALFGTAYGRRLLRQVLRAKLWMCLACGARLPRLADACPRCGEPT